MKPNDEVRSRRLTVECSSWGKCSDNLNENFIVEQKIHEC